MPVDIIVGGQGGDEGKGKIAAYLALRKYGNYSICMRISGPNAGHTIHYKRKKIPLATLPCGFVNKDLRVLIGRGAFISVSRLEEEIKKTKLTPERLGIDRYATIITPEQREQERANNHLMGKIGSVGTGLGICRRNKIKRGAGDKVVFAKDIPELEPYLTDTTEELYEELSQKGNVLLEGDQGFKLSLIHGEYPYVTSRDTTASTFLGEAGIGPKEVRDVYIVFKPYVTRVAPGPLENEITDEKKLKWAHTKGKEFGSVSGRKRRLGEFEWEEALKAIQFNSANKICITHMDYFGNKRAMKKNGILSKKAAGFMAKIKERLESQYPYPITSLLSYGPDINDILEVWM